MKDHTPRALDAYNTHISLGQWVELLKQLAEGGRPGKVLRRCNTCMREHRKDPWWLLKKAYYDGENFHGEHDLDKLREILKAKLLFKYDKVSREIIRRSAARYLKRHSARLSKQEQVYFSMLAGASAILNHKGVKDEQARRSRRCA